MTNINQTDATVASFDSHAAGEAAIKSGPNVARSVLAEICSPAAGGNGR